MKRAIGRINLKGVIPNYLPYEEENKGLDTRLKSLFRALCIR